MGHLGGVISFVHVSFILKVSFEKHLPVKINACNGCHFLSIINYTCTCVPNVHAFVSLIGDTEAMGTFNYLPSCNISIISHAIITKPTMVNDLKKFNTQLNLILFAKKKGF